MSAVLAYALALTERGYKMADKRDDLDDFYAALKRGATVASFLEDYQRIKEFIHAAGLTEDYRLARGRTKKLSDEVVPVVRFVRMNASSEDRISFALDNTSPDCLVRHEDGRLREIEITVIQARERFNVMAELNTTGTGRGFIGLSDDAPTEEFNAKMDQPSVGYSTDEVSQSIIRGVALAARRKRNHQGHTLLIEAPLQTLAAERWDEFRAQLAEKVKELAFSEIYVTGRSKRDICLRIQ